MARRGAELRAHILDTAKFAFLETGYERTSMDAVAARAQTSKRSLYAHFPTKDALFLAVVDSLDERFRGRLLSPEHYADDPGEAVALFCGRFLQVLSYTPILLTLRLGITEAERLPAASGRLYEVYFGTAESRLADYLRVRYGLADDGDGDGSAALAAWVLGMAVYPTVLRALFGVGGLELRDEMPDEGAIEADVDLAAIRAATRLALAALSVPPERITQ